MSHRPSELEIKLRALMDIAAGEPQRPVTLDAVRRRVLRRRRVASAAAVATLALACSVGVAVAAGRVLPGHLPTGPTAGSHSASVAVPGKSGVPRYYVVRSVVPNSGNAPNREETTVRATATGAVQAHLRCPVSAPYIMTWPVAAAANQNFFLVCQRATGPQSYSKVLESRIFEFHVTSSGLVTSELPVRGGELGAVLVRSIAVTPNGSQIAVTVYPGTHPPDLHRTPPDVIVIDTRTGAHAVWRGAAPVSGLTAYWPQDVSMTADGQRLVFLTQPQCFRSGCTTRGGQQMRVIIHPASGGGQLNSARVLVQLNSVLPLSSATVMDAVTSPNGSTLTLAIMGTLDGQPSQISASVVAIPASGQRQLRFLYRLPGADSVSFFAADPQGRHFLLGTGTAMGPLAGRISNGSLIPLKPDPVSVASMVW